MLVGQTLPHAPQFDGSELGSVQYIPPAAFEQGFCGAGQLMVVVLPSTGGGGVTHAPSTQVKPPEQTRPQSPQFDGSRSTTAQYILDGTAGSEHSLASDGHMIAGGVTLQTPL